MKKYLVVVNNYKEFSSCDHVLKEWELDPDYENGKRVFYIVSAKNKISARHQLVRLLISTWYEEFTQETFWHLNDCFLDGSICIDKEFLDDNYDSLTDIYRRYGKRLSLEQFNQLINDDIKLAMYQDLQLTTYHAYEFSEIGN